MAVVFAMSTQLGGIGPKYQDLVTLFQILNSEPLPAFHLQALQARRKNYLLYDNTVHKSNLTGKYFMEPSKLKPLQC